MPVTLSVTTVSLVRARGVISAPTWISSPEPSATRAWLSVSVIRLGGSALSTSGSVTGCTSSPGAVPLTVSRPSCWSIPGWLSRTEKVLSPAEVALPDRQVQRRMDPRPDLAQIAGIASVIGERQPNRGVLLPRRAVQRRRDRHERLRPQVLDDLRLAQRQRDPGGRRVAVVVLQQQRRARHAQPAGPSADRDRLVALRFLVVHRRELEGGVAALLPGLDGDLERLHRVEVRHARPAAAAHRHRHRGVRRLQAVDCRDHGDGRHAARNDHETKLPESTSQCG